MPERDTVQARRGGRPGPQVPLVQLSDPSYEDRPQIPLVDDGERHVLAGLVRQGSADEWREGFITRRDRKQARIWGSVVAVAALGSCIVSVVDLVLHFAAHP